MIVCVCRLFIYSDYSREKKKIMQISSFFFFFALEGCERQSLF